jgi:hypothetical protein
MSGRESHFQPVSHHMLFCASNLPLRAAISDVKRCAYPCRRVEGGGCQARHGEA